MTNGIYHAEGARKSRKSKNKATGYSSKRKADNVDCSELREMFDYSDYCGMCYRKAKVTHPHLTSIARKQMIKTKSKVSDAGGKPKLGCLNCNERVCKVCWADYDHEPNRKKN